MKVTIWDRIPLAIGATQSPRWLAYDRNMNLRVSKPLGSRLLLKRCQSSQWGGLKAALSVKYVSCVFIHTLFHGCDGYFIHRYPSSIHQTKLKSRPLVESDWLYPSKRVFDLGPILLSLPQILHDQRFKGPWRSHRSLRNNTVSVVDQSTVGGNLPACYPRQPAEKSSRAPTALLIWFSQCLMCQRSQFVERA